MPADVDLSDGGTTRITPMPNLSDATHAYRGYRHQALYTLFRVFKSGNAANLIFQPEGEEDLSIFDTANNLIEVVQVKSYGRSLTLSDFKPDQKNSFFYRVDALLKANPCPRIRIASFGTVGPELLCALETDAQDRQRVAHKLSEYNFLLRADAQVLLGNIHIEKVDEDALTQSVYDTLRNSLAGVDPEAAFELLNYWLYICSEKKAKITRQDLIDGINKVGKFAAERALHHDQWFTTIVPIEDHTLDAAVHQELADEFYLGVSTRYDHILANLDVIRSAKLEQIAQKFEDTRVVIVHGPSGQGKTTLALRYLREYFPSQWRFQVKLIENKQHALSIATALVGHADALDIPIAVYLDVNASDRDWPDLVKQLAIHRNIRVLVTIREEDFQRASITGVTMHFSTVMLSFEESEARDLYQSLGQRQVSAQFLSFEDAWRTFGGGGPLMEFVYLVTQGNSLYDRLSEQVARLEEEVRMGKLRSSELALLRLISVASAFDARLQVKPLVESLGLAAPQRTFKYFEQEYLLRLSDDGSLVHGLHPIRSAMLCDLLTDPTFTPWAESVQACFPFMYTPDIEVFLLHAFSRQQHDTLSLLETLRAYQTDQWIALAGITRALIWLGVHEYVDTNRELIQETFGDAGQGWSLVLDQDVADITPGGAAERWQTLLPMIPAEKRRQLEAAQARQTDKGQIFVHAQDWLTSCTQQPKLPVTDADWTTMAEVLFWVGRLHIAWPLADWLPAIPFDAAVDTLPIEVLGDVMLGLFHSSPTFFDTYRRTHRPRITTRFRQKTQTIVLEDNGEQVTAHFIVEMEQTSTTASDTDLRARAAKDRLHEEAHVRVDLMRRLFPDRELYACQGYGHKVGSFDLPFDSTQMTGVARKYLPLLWLTSVNAMFRRLAEREFHPHTWRDYVHLVFGLRCDVVFALKQLASGIERYFRSQRYGGRDNIVDSDDWKAWVRRLNHPPLLPSCVLDEWGLIDEHTTEPINLEMQGRAPVISKNGLALQAYKPFLDTLRSYTASLSNFFDQSIHVMTINPLLGRNAPDGAARPRILAHAAQLGVRTDMAHISTYNLAEAVKDLPQLQREFRQLLGHFVADAELTQIECEEQQSFRYAWSLWYFFGAQPQRLVLHPQTLMGQATEIMKRIRSTLLRRLRALSGREICVSITSEKVLWHFEPALWLTIDGKDPVAVYQMFETVIQAIREAVRRVPETELRRYMLDFSWPYVVIVPLVRGKSLHATAWRLSLPALLQEDELQWWRYSQAQIPSDAMTALGISTWQDTRLEPASKYLLSMTELFLYAAHIGNFLNMPELDEEGSSQLQEYMEQVIVPLSTAFQSTIDAGTILVSTFNGLSPEEQAQRPHLILAVKALVAMQSNHLPTDHVHGSLHMTIPDIAEWADRLKTACQHAGLVYYFWVSDALDI